MVATTQVLCTPCRSISTRARHPAAVSPASGNLRQAKYARVSRRFQSDKITDTDQQLLLLGFFDLNSDNPGSSASTPLRLVFFSHTQISPVDLSPPRAAPALKRLPRVVGRRHTTQVQKDSQTQLSLLPSFCYILSGRLLALFVESVIHSPGSTRPRL